MYQYLKIERIATPCCDSKYILVLKNVQKGKVKKKNQSINSVIAKLSHWFGFPTYSRCIAVGWNWTATVAGATPGQRNDLGIAHWVLLGQLELGMGSETIPMVWGLCFSFYSALNKSGAGTYVAPPGPYPAHPHGAMHVLD